MTPTRFRAIVIGGGPVGLTTAHALSQAGIDFVMLERRPNIIIDAGSNLVLLPMGLRVLYQLGLRNALDIASSPLGSIDRFDHEGQDIGDLKFFEHDKEYFGAYPRVLSRHDLTQVLYDSLPTDAQGKILPNKKVQNIETTPDGVLVSCADGTSYAGSIAIAADGAHSLTREYMRTLALEAGSPDINEEKPFLTTYKALWLRFPTSISPHLRDGLTCETRGCNAATQLFVGEKTCVVAVYDKLEVPTRERMRFTQADQDSLIERWGHLPLLRDGKLSLREAYDARTQSGLVCLEEGVLKHWSWDGRIVLTGDSAHKFSPATGAGCNNGIIDVVALVNKLNETIQKAQAETENPSGVPTRTQLAATFKDYQDSRYEAVLAGCKKATDATALATWQSGLLRIFDRYLLSIYMVQKYLSSQEAPMTARTPVFDFISGHETVSGRVPWLMQIGAKAR